ncbi:MAG: 6-phosphogluconolactonase [Leptolyngbya foveolarum]|uniref:6-phosphogluconolactonase n=1 Tax=Leptolyngbya foveolarum TaxID=47253 RepID=A0A2W4TJL2_9CYAN|nr:MAG: 6-phosphogluconolactonase [Leptolyngbya foveolarum]
MAPTVEILSDQPALIERAHQIMVETIKTAIAKRDRATVALSGGSTPKPLYESLVNADIPWEKLYVFWGDERYVPHDHPKSNARMTSEAWLNHVAIPEENIFRVPTSAQAPAADAAKYAKTLRDFFKSDEVAVIDFVLQGMGDDGHTASLFPFTEALDVRDRLVTIGNHDGDPRITFTVPLINQARKIVFLVSGENKQKALSQVFSPDANDHEYPSKLIQTANPHWLLDAAAGKGIPDQYK